MKWWCDPIHRNNMYTILIFIVLIQQPRSSDGARTVTSHLVILPRGGGGGSSSSSSHSQPFPSPRHASSSSSSFAALTLGDIESAYEDNDNTGRHQEDNVRTRHRRQQPAGSPWFPKLRPILARTAAHWMVPTQQYTHQLDQEYPVLVTMTVTCIVTWMAWHVRIQSLQQNIMNPYFICRRSQLTIRYGKILSLVLSAVSHIDIYHLIYNLMAFLSLGPAVQSILTRKMATKPILAHLPPLRGWSLVDTRMWQLVMGAALSGSVAYLVLPKGGKEEGCLGLSTVTMAMLSIFALAHPERVLQTRLLNFIPIRMPAIRLLLFTLVGSVLGCALPLISKYHDNISHSGHLGGLLFGVAFYDIIIMDRPPFLNHIDKIRR